MAAPKGTPAILIRMTAAERTAANEDARARGLSLNDYIRLLLRRGRRERLARSGEPVVEIDID